MNQNEQETVPQLLQADVQTLLKELYQLGKKCRIGEPAGQDAKDRGQPLSIDVRGR
jgi:hypothetical protein